MKNFIKNNMHMHVFKYLKDLTCLKFDKTILNYLIKYIPDRLYINYKNYSLNPTYISTGTFFPDKYTIINTSLTTLTFGHIHKHIIFENVQNLTTIDKLRAYKLSTKHKLNSVKFILNGFLLNCNINAIDLDLFTNLFSVGNYFLAHNKLKFLNMSKLNKLTTIEHSFCLSNRIETIILPTNSSIIKINYNFLKRNRLTKINLDALSKLTCINSSFLENNKLNDINLSPLKRVSALGSHFLSNNLLYNIDITQLCRLIIIYRPGFLHNNLISEAVVLNILRKYEVLNFTEI